jgi:hypothetical protein
MPRSLGLFHRAFTAFGAPVGVALTSWSYIWRITPVWRTETEGSLAEDAPPPLPSGVSHEGAQMPDSGSGPLFRRTYTGSIRDASCTPAELIRRLSEDPNRVVPLSLARFHKTHGPEWRMAVGDEFLIRMPGPWDGPVRVIEVTDSSFRFVTLDRHLEAGQIEWRAFERDDRVIFQVESRSRAGDRLAALLHERLPMAKEVQLHMWTSVVEHVAKAAGGRLTGGVRVETRQVDPAAFGD